MLKNAGLTFTTGKCGTEMQDRKIMDQNVQKKCRSEKMWKMSNDFTGNISNMVPEIYDDINSHGMGTKQHWTDIISTRIKAIHYTYIQKIVCSCTLTLEFWFM